MEIILPNEFESFESTLRLDHFTNARAEKHSIKVNLSLPRFKIGGGAKSTSLKSILSAMGLAHCFSDNADFSFMDPSNSIKISDVFHKAVIEVNEEGAEATAAAGAELNLKCMP